MSMAHIRKHYGVPAKRGGRVKFCGNIGREPMKGTIIGSRDGRLRVRFDGMWACRILHPKWCMEYLEDPPA